MTYYFLRIAKKKNSKTSVVNEAAKLFQKQVQGTQKNFQMTRKIDKQQKIEMQKLHKVFF